MTEQSNKMWLRHWRDGRISRQKIEGRIAGSAFVQTVDVLFPPRTRLQDFALVSSVARTDLSTAVNSLTSTLVLQMWKSCKLEFATVGLFSSLHLAFFILALRKEKKKDVNHLKRAEKKKLSGSAT